MEELSEHFSWEETVITQQRNVDNTLPENLIPVIKNTAKGMERVRALLGAPIIVSSWYRSPQLNAKIGGSTKSQHMSGEAVDFICPSYGSPLKVVRKLSSYPELIRYDQLILEHSWIHISFRSDPTAQARRQVLTLLASGGYANGITDKHGNVA